MVYVYALHILTIVMAKGRRVGGGGHLRVYDCQIAYSERIRGVYNS